jgi:hypothetical protein
LVCGCGGERGRAVTGGLLLGPRRQLRVRGVAEAHHAEAARVGRGGLDGKRGGLVVASAGRGSHDLAGRGPAAIFRHSDAPRLGSLARVVDPRILVAALEEVGGIEGAASLEVLVAAARSERPQRHYSASASGSSTRGRRRSAAHSTARRGVGDVGWQGAVRAALRKAERCC